jgi:hypothetical protein
VASKHGRGTVTGAEIDRLYTDWLGDIYGEEIASEYRAYSLVIPMWNPPDLNDALETLRQVLCIAFGPDQYFGTTDYHEARRKLQLHEERVEIPEVFIRAFA